MKQAKHLWLTIGTMAAVFALGLPHAFAQQASTATVIVVCDISKIGLFGDGSVKPGNGKRLFQFDASSGTPRSVIDALRSAETCADAEGVLKNANPNPRCSTSAAANKYIATCDLTTEQPPN